MAASRQPGLRFMIREDFLSCGICLDKFVEPKSLRCLHSFCKNCLQEHVRSQKKPYKSGIHFPCPVCRKFTRLPDEDVSRLPNNFWISSLDDMVSNCLSLQETSETTDREQNQPTCDRHTGSLVTSICSNCMETLCSDCLVEILGEKTESHKGHTISSLKDACSTIDKQVESSLANCIRKLDELEKIASNVPERQRLLNEKKEDVEAAIDTRAENLKSLVDDWAKRSKDDIEDQFIQQKETIDKICKSTSNASHQLTVRCQNLVDILPNVYNLSKDNLLLIRSEIDATESLLEECETNISSLKSDIHYRVSDLCSKTGEYQQDSIQLKACHYYTSSEHVDTYALMLSHPEQIAPQLNYMPENLERICKLHNCKISTCAVDKDDNVFFIDLISEKMLVLGRDCSLKPHPYFGEVGAALVDITAISILADNNLAVLWGGNACVMIYEESGFLLSTILLSPCDRFSSMALNKNGDILVTGVSKEQVVIQVARASDIYIDQGNFVPLYPQREDELYCPCIESDVSTYDVYIGINNATNDMILSCTGFQGVKAFSQENDSLKRLFSCEEIKQPGHVCVTREGTIFAVDTGEGLCVLSHTDRLIQRCPDTTVMDVLVVHESDVLMITYDGYDSTLIFSSH